MKVREFLDRVPKILISKVVMDKVITGACIDSRKIIDGTVFFAVKGNNLDGNDFAQEALSLGASIVVMSDREKFEKIEGSKVLVEDAVTAAIDIGRNFFHTTGAKKIVITGSFGKTSTKEMMKEVLSQKYKVHSTDGNYNNRLGVGLTGASIPENAEIVVVEIGSNGVGEIAELAAMIRPDIAIVTNVGHAHIGKFGSLDATIREKLSVADALPSGGVLVVPQVLSDYVTNRSRVKFMTFGETRASDISLTRLTHHGSSIEFEVSKDATDYMLHTSYSHSAMNALSVIMVAKLLEVDNEEIKTGLLKIMPVKGRGNLIKVGRLTIIDDSYNAGLESVIKSVESLSKMDDDEKYAILGEIGEIDGHENKIYSAIYELAKLYPAIKFLLIGDAFMTAAELKNCKIFRDKSSARGYIETIQKGVVLVKASHSKKFNEIIEILQEAR